MTTWIDEQGNEWTVEEIRKRNEANKLLVEHGVLGLASKENAEYIDFLLARNEELERACESCILGQAEKRVRELEEYKAVMDTKFYRSEELQNLAWDVPDGEGYWLDELDSIWDDYKKSEIMCDAWYSALALYVVENERVALGELEPEAQPCAP